MSGFLGGLLNNLTGGGQNANNTETEAGSPSSTVSLGGPLGGAGGAAIAGFVSHAIEQAGGIDGVIAKFQQAGLAQQAQSWVEHGTANLSVSTAEIEQVFPPQEIDAWAQRHGLPAGLASQVLAHVLPSTVDRATPQGTDANGQPVTTADNSQLGGILGRLLG